MTSGTRTRLDVAFPSSDDECRAWLFMPDAERPPLVILGHGLGATREYGLEPYAERFADAGIAALVFTYRHFGDSGGEPRQLLDIERQLGDWAAALAYARNLDGIDHERIARTHILPGIRFVLAEVPASVIIRLNLLRKRCAGERQC